MGRLHAAARPRRLDTGLTLTELMIVLVVVSILAAVALPSYREYARRSVRAEAQAYMQAVAARQQQFLVDTRLYAATLADLGIPAPDRVLEAYQFELQLLAGPPQAWVLTATPTGDQAGEACGTLSVDQSGARTAARGNCW